MRIQHNILAMNAYRNYQNNTSALGKNLEKLSSGYRINRAGDDAAGLAISEKMRAQITGLDAAQKNVKDGISLVKTAEGAMQEIQDMLNRMDYLATQSANGTYQNEVDRENLQKEVNALRTEINRIADSSNFNGIKLLDGSLASEQAVDKITISGENAKGVKSAGSKAIFGSDVALAAGTGAVEGGTASYSVSLSDNTSYNVNFTFAKDTAGNVTKMVAEDGTEYTITAGAPTAQQLTAAISAELKKTGLNDLYTIEADKKYDATNGTATGNGQFAFTAKEAGTSTPTITAVDFHADYAATGNTHTTHTASNVEGKNGTDAGVEIKADDLVEYNGTNYEDAVFEINGHKFLLLQDDLDANTLTGTLDNPNNTDALHTFKGVPSDVTILVGGKGGLKKGAAAGTGPDGAEGANSNWDQNIKAIAKATGLNVGDGIDESAYLPAATKTGADPGEGIRLTLSNKKAEGKGLTLQIGDTADSFNQLKVNIGDMHAKGMGIDKIDISTQAGAQSAISTIKDAINYVSSIRGDLGAVQNRLEHTQNNLAVMQENIQDAESTIRDTDVAAEMMAYTKNNILVQSAQAMLAQANAVPQGVLQLLQ